ncbi:hypothetical protein [Palleronia marisminoris]|uniref:hypothetical protein n=1 Tax=Palleronia marisminoris TaxID=315423 RepID=UPI0011139D20|nr:hypothetical protein [Palleronia marisminoris]
MPVQIAKLSETIDFLERSVDPQHSLPAPITRSARKAVELFVEVLKLPSSRCDKEDLPPEPKVDLLRRAGVPVVSQSEQGPFPEEAATGKPRSGWSATAAGPGNR